MGTEQDGMEKCSPSEQPQGSASTAAPAAARVPESTVGPTIEKCGELSATAEPMFVAGDIPQCPEGLVSSPSSSAYTRAPDTVLVSSNGNPQYVQYVYHHQDISPQTDQDIQMEVAQSLTELSTVRTLPLPSPVLVQQPIMVVTHASDVSPPSPAPKLAFTNHLSDNPVISLTRSKNGTFTIIHDESVALDKKDEKLLQKIAKTAAHRPLKGDKDAASANLDSEIIDVVVKYEEEEALKKITMRDLRHIIPLLIMRCYNISDEPYQRKVRGMWTDKPENWPDHIPYCDPNNKKNNGKPKKDTLLDMFKHLRDFYLRNYPAVVVEYKRSKHGVSQCTYEGAVIPQAMEALEASPASPGMTHPAQPSTTIASYTLPVSISSPTPISTSALEARVMPKQEAVKVERDVEIFQRIEDKLKLTDSEEVRSFFNPLYDILRKIYLVRSQDLVFFLEVAHDFECSLDVLTEVGNLPNSHVEKWNKFYQKHGDVPDLAHYEQVQDTVEETQELGREEEVATDNIYIITSKTSERSPPAYITTSDIEPFHDADSSSANILSIPTSYTKTTITSLPEQNMKNIIRTNSLVEDKVPVSDILSRLTSELNVSDITTPTTGIEYEIEPFESFTPTHQPTSDYDMVNLPKSQGPSTSIQGPPATIQSFVDHNKDQPLFTQATPTSINHYPALPTIISHAPSTSIEAPPTYLHPSFTTTQAPPSSQLEANGISDYPLSSEADLTDFSDSLFEEVNSSTPMMTLDNTPMFSNQTSTANPATKSATPSRSTFPSLDLSKLQLPRSASVENNDRFKIMASAVFNNIKNSQKPVTGLPFKKLLLLPNPRIQNNLSKGGGIIPSVVEDMEKKAAEEDAVPRKKMKRGLKRALPATAITTDDYSVPGYTM